MSGLKKLASETAVYGVSTIMVRLLNYLLVPLYTGLFNPEQYGVVTKLYAIIAFFNILLTYGMETAFFRFSSEGHKNTYATAFNSILISSLLFLLLCWPQSAEIAELVKESGQTSLIHYCVLILVFDAVSALPFAYLRQQGKARRFAFLRSISILLNVVFNLLFLYYAPEWVKDGWNPLGLFSDKPEVAFIFIANLLASGITLLLLIPEWKGLESGIDFGLWKKMMVYALPLLLVGFAGMVNETFDRVILEYLLPPDTAKHDVGVYGACYKLSILMSLFIQAFRFAAEPFFFSQSQSGDRNIYARATHYFALFCMVIFLLVALFLDVFKHFLRDEAFHEGLPVVPILLLANLFLGVYYNLSIWYKLANKTMTGAYISVFGAALTIGLNLLFIPFSGYMGAAWTTLLVYAFMMVTTYLTGQKYYPIPYRVRRFFVYLIFMLGLFLIGEMMNGMADTTMKYAGKSLLLLGFMTVVFLVEKPRKSLTSQQ